MHNINRALMMSVGTGLMAVFVLAQPVSSLDCAVVPGPSGQTVEERNERLREWEKKQEKARNRERYKDLKKDTEKLLQLATDLKIAVDKSNEQTLSMDVVKKAGEVGKLAKSIEKKMKGD